MDSSPQPILTIYSHGRNPPLHPPPDLKYDLRNIPNPPKALRQASDGRSKRLREHLLSEAKFVQRLEAVEQDIFNAMESKLAEYAAQQKDPEVSEEPQDQGPSLSRDGKAPQNSNDGEEAEDEEASGSSLAEDEVVLRVGCNCALGHHRSVAFVEELSRREWPREWQIQVIHRDLEKKRAGGARRAQKASFRGKMQDAYE